jgi:Flp pilus assembly pilin Flp
MASVSEDGNHRKGSHPLALISSVVKSIRTSDRGQGLAEYALILSLIAIVAIIAVVFLGSRVSGLLNTVGKSV